MLDCRLQFDNHVSCLCAKIYPKLKFLSKIRSSIGKNLSLYLYNCLLNPLFAFNDHIFDVVNKSDAIRLQVLQNNCIRICLNCDKRKPRSELYTESGIKPLKEQRLEHTSTLVYQGLNQISTPFINNLFTRKMANTGLQTRSAIKGDIHVPYRKLKVTQGTIRVRGPETYNLISTDIREAKTVTSFQSRLKRARIFETHVT